MKGWNKWIIGIEWGIIITLMAHFIIKDWNKTPLVKDYFALLIIGELIFESYNRIKGK